MNRKSFLKKIALSAGVAVVTPTLLKAKESPKDKQDSQNPMIAVDINSISNFRLGGRQISPMEILEMYQQTGVLLYHSSRYCHAPIVLKGSVEVVGFNKIKP